ncbi:hypothetical protein Tco_0998184 [Tanacetum coccineum]
MRSDESFNVTFDEIFLEPKLSHLVEDDGMHEQVVQDPNRSPSLGANVLELGYPKNVKEARGHQIEQVINLCERHGSGATLLYYEMKDMYRCII